MANRRMISNTVVRTARFLKMPPTTQNLYFHLVLNTDDDGVVEGFPVMRLVGATEDDLKILVEKVFVYLLNDDLVAYIADWNEQNTISPSRKVDSIYKDLLLKIVPDIDYKESTKKNNKVFDDNVSTTSRQSSDILPSNCPPKLSKDKLSKGKISKDSSNNKETTTAEILSFWEQNGFGLLAPKTIQDFDYWVQDFEKIGASKENAIALIIHSLGIAVDNGVKKYAYVNTILKDWEQHRYLTVEQVKAEDKKKVSNQSNDNERVWLETGEDW